MKVTDWLKSAEKRLRQAGIGTARLDALVLLEDASQHDRAWLLAHPEYELKATQIASLKNLLKRRAQHEPLAYLRGKTEFYGREFLVTPAVLEPRPESETMIDLLKKLPDLPSDVRISDVGAGSGALGITAALELPKSHVELLELDLQALKVAKMNVDKFTLHLPVTKSDLLSSSKNNSQVLLCNLPYVPDSFQINPAALHEPRTAIFGGTDGLNLYRRLFMMAQKQPLRPLYILTEALPPQHAGLQAIANQHSYTQADEDDFIQLFRPARIQT